MSPTKSLLALIALGCLGSASAAFASTPSTCATDSDCGRGYVCQSSTSGGSGTTPPPDCPPDVACDKKDPGTTGTGGTTEVTPPTIISMCQLGPCVADSDCGVDMVCHAETSAECSGGSAVAPCETGTKCDAPVVSEPTCTTKTRSICAFKWQLPCNADADCGGSGFVCRPSVSGSCSGGTPVARGTGGQVGTGPSSDGAGNSSVPPADCTTTTSYPGSCQAAVSVCATDADCPGTWTCQATITRGTAGAGGASGAGATSGSGSGVSTTVDAQDLVIVAETKTCSPPYISPFAVGKDGGDERTGSAPSGGSGGTVGSTGPAAGNGTGGATQLDDSAAPPSANGGAGCSVSSGGRHSGTGLVLIAFAGLGLALARSRRRR